MSKDNNTQEASIDFADALKERYLAYALSTITSRSLPDARDGLKPVHRRILFAMRALKLDPSSGYKKCARIVGDVMGKFHPHGDQAIYDAMVRLAQSFAVRYPLVDGQGNFGNIDGDNPAAMRYTEARLSAIAELLLDGLDEDAVDFAQTYDGSEKEPLVLPANFPNCLANGAAGIAVGMATSIPPHNVLELLKALIALVREPGISEDALIKLIPAPDFPTGGRIIAENHNELAQIYKTGRGVLRLRAHWEIEKQNAGTWQIVVTEMPFGVPKSRLIEKIAELMQARKLPFLNDIHDESSEDIRLVLIPRSRNINPDQMMEALFKITELEIKFSVNMNVLINKGRVPALASLQTILQTFIDHRMDVQLRIMHFRIDKLERRIETLAGYLIAYLNLHEIIAIIRDHDKPKAILIERFQLSEIQAEAILNMRLRTLRKLEEVSIKEEHTKLVVELKELKTLSSNKNLQSQKLIQDFLTLKKKFEKQTNLCKRRTQIIQAPHVDTISSDTFVEREPITVVCSKSGWIRSVRGHITNTQSLKYREGDQEGFIIKAYTTDKLLGVFSNGKFYTISPDKLIGNRSLGEPINLIFDIEQGAQLVALLIYKSDSKLLLASNMGHGFLIESTNVIAQTRTGKQIMNLDKGAQLLQCIEAEGDQIACISSARKLLIYDLEHIPILSRGRGVSLQRLKDNIRLSDVCVFDKQVGLQWQSGTRIRTQVNLSDWQGKRTGAGKIPPYGFPRNNKFSTVA